MPSITRTNAATVFLALQAELVTGMTLGAERVLMNLDDELPDFDPHGDHYIVLRDRGVKGQLMGGGRFDSRVRHRAAATLRTRLALDDPATDTVLLTDATRGHQTLAQTMRNVLEGTLLEQTGGNAYLHEALHVVDATPAQKAPARPGWAQADYVFELCYTLNVDHATITDL